ncbi:NADP-dependent oxidoreductase [Microbaculum marinisediminis]|uniref:NADP-dependent oxidoreductase n=1 Tax=Microbaculum marinisediminis TaxID=2931392 RepID=A0AAW5QTQ1_9HYPH|nr:NADP-dependent oxidoreductase [Microbaculum sp. A6E488]MCT8970259.1 NADP-dependent oxidoreductase [Microbaculum sp. A6E488]
MTTNRLVRLRSRPVGMVRRDDFEIVDEPARDAGEGEFRVRIEYVSLDPAMRGWIAAGKSYVPPVEIGAVMRGFAAGHVDQSNHPDYKVGDAVAGLLGVQHYAVSKGERCFKVDPTKAPLERWIGGLGMPGQTAYFGLLEVGKPKPGETVVVSAASGAVGSIVGQIAKIVGCRAVGIAGGPEKCRYVVEELGFDACADYKGGNLAEELKAACPDGVDVYYENVGGEILDTVLPMMNLFGRIPVCGLISAYNATEPQPGPKNLRSILVNRLTMRGLIVFDFQDRMAEANEKLGQWHAEGRLRMREDVREGGIEAFPDVLNLLYTGGNFGKLVLKL